MLSDHQKLWRDKHELSLSPYSRQKSFLIAQQNLYEFS